MEAWKILAIVVVWTVLGFVVVQLFAWLQKRKR